MILVQDANALRGAWKFGLVDKVYVDNKGYVRTVNISYKNLSPTEPVHLYQGKKPSVIKRPSNKVVVLVPSDEDVVLKLGEEFVNKPKVLNADAKEFVPKKNAVDTIDEEDRINPTRVELDKKQSTAKPVKGETDEKKNVNQKVSVKKGTIKEGVKDKDKVEKVGRPKRNVKPIQRLGID